MKPLTREMAFLQNGLRASIGALFQTGENQGALPAPYSASTSRQEEDLNCPEPRAERCKRYLHQVRLIRFQLKRPQDQ